MLRFWHLASLDAPTVAVVWTLAFAWAARVRLPAWVPLLAALVVWVVYVADRLLDARGDLRAGIHGRLRERHLFHWRHRRLLAPLVAVAAVAAAWMVLWLVPAPVRQRDSLLAAAALVYLTRVHSPQTLLPGLSLPRILARPIETLWRKELLAGLLFTAGCLLPAWSRATAPISVLLAPGVVFALLAWLNCALIDRWESVAAGGAAGSHAAVLLALVALVTAIAAAGAMPRIAALLATAALSALLLALLDRSRSRLTPLALRAAADLVLLTPALLAPALLR